MKFDHRVLCEGTEWTYNHPTFHKDGYEVYIDARSMPHRSNEAVSVEFTVKDPETGERIFIVNRRIDGLSPHYFAILKYILDNAEELALREQNQKS